MNHPPLVQLTTARLTLRKAKASDWEMVSYLRSDQAVNRFVKRPAAETKEKALSFLSKAIEDTDAQRLYYWIMTEKTADQMIGSICLWSFSDDRKTAELGYDLSPEFHGKGIMNEALEQVLAFGFQTLELDKIEAYTQQNNMPSRKLLERNGFAVVPGKTDEDNAENIVYALCKIAS